MTEEKISYQICPMDRSHIAQIARLEQQVFSTPWSERALEEELYHDHASFLVAQDQRGNVLGYGGLHVVLDEGYITNIAVFPAMQRQGIATKILDTFCRFGDAHLSFITLEVRASNQPAIALYKGREFIETATRKDFYKQPTEDAILMTRWFKTEQGREK